MRLIITLLVLITMWSSSCKPAGPTLEPLDLLSEGLPLKINAPADAVVTTSDLGIMKDVTIKSESGYSIQIFESEAKSLDVTKLLAEIKAEVEGSRYFSKIINEDEAGFIFERKVDETYINYDFRYVQIRGDKQYVIQSGLSSQQTLDDIKSMYKSVM